MGYLYNGNVAAANRAPTSECVDKTPGLFLLRIIRKLFEEVINVF